MAEQGVVAMATAVAAMAVAAMAMAVVARARAEMVSARVAAGKEMAAAERGREGGLGEQPGASCQEPDKPRSRPVPGPSCLSLFGVL
jgi:DNA invertase Pin-like site-specific DNA recombinase